MVSALCAHLFVSLNYVLFIMACWLVTIKKIKNKKINKKNKLSMETSLPNGVGYVIQIWLVK